MEVRDAVEADAERLGELADGPRDVMRNLIHDRTVRVAVTPGADVGSGDGDGSDDERTTIEETATEETATEETVEEEREGDPAETVVGFVSFDAREGTVHVTQLAGDADALARLLEEPVGFAEREGMAVELLVPEDEPMVRTAAEDAGFQGTGSGPRFEGTPTKRYRREPEKARQ